MLGARRSKIVVGVACMVLFWHMAGIRRVHAVEFGNMLFPSIQQQSREASALALDAISMALRGIAELERNKTDISQELLKQSAGQLNRATQEMDAILSKANLDQQFQRYLDQQPNIEAVPKADWEAFINSLAKDNLPVPKNRREVLLLFIKKTRELSANLEKTDQRLRDIGDYLKFGDLVTRLMRIK
jgi:hypothetical protein